MIEEDSVRGQVLSWLTHIYVYIYISNTKREKCIETNDDGNDVYHGSRTVGVFGLSLKFCKEY
jgi:hypothetical protein